MSSWLVVLFLFLTVVRIDTVSSLKCYACTDPMDLNKDCENNIKDVERINCTGTQVCGQFIREKPATKILHRGCYQPDVCTTEEREVANAPEVNLRDCKVCSEDLCNGNGSEKAMGSFVFLFCVLSMIVFNSF